MILPIKNITAFSCLHNIFGLGEIRAKKLMYLLRLTTRSKKEFLQEKYRLEDLTEILSLLCVGDKLRLNILSHLVKLKTNESFRGLRSSAKLPIRGQRTHTNAKSQTKLSTFTRFFNYNDIQDIVRSRYSNKVVGGIVPRRYRKSKAKSKHKSKEVIIKKKKTKRSKKR